MNVMRVCVLFVVLFFGTTNYVKSQTSNEIIDKMISAVSAGKSFEYTMKQTERINGKIYVNKIFTKVNENPKKIFIDNIEGDNEGVQLLYVQGERDGKALVNKLFGIKLSPFNSLIRKNQHHTILESGFGLLLNSIKEAKSRAQAEGRFNDVFQYVGTVTYNGKPCYKLILNDPTFTYKKYTISSGESLYSIAMKHNVAEQLIVEKNDLNGFGSAKAGNTILIPSSYAKKTILYIDKSTYYPVYQEMHDENGLFEKYEFYGLKINPTFTSVDFSEDNSNYNF